MADGSVIIDTKIDTSGAEKGADDIVKSLESILGYMQNISSSINKIVSSLTGGSNAASKAVSNLTDNLEATADAGRRAVKEVSKFDPSDVSGITIHRWNDDSNLIGDTSEISDQQRQELAENAKAAKEAAQEEADAFNGAKEKVNELYESIKKTKEELKSLEKSGQWWGDDEYDQAAIKLNELNNQAKEYKKITLSPEIDSTADSVSRLGEKVDSLSKKLMAAGIDGLKNKIKSVGKTIDGLVSKLLKLTSSAIIGGLQRISSGIFGIHKSANKSTLSLKNLLKYAFGIRSLFVLFNKLRSAIVTGFQNLAKYDLATQTGDVNNSISSLMSALTRLKNSFATAFAPILTTVAPILTNFINLISEAVTRVGMLVAALTGKDTFTKAIGVQENYAASLDKSASSANKAKKATNGYLSSLDEIKRYDDGKSDSGTGSSGGYTAPSASDMFETVPIESSINDIADKIKKYIEDQDWEGLGSYMASGINTGLEKVYEVISWDNVGPKITPFITGFTTTFNSLVDNINWELMGQTVGTGINTIVKALNLAITGIDWYNLGKKFAKGIKGIVTTVDWNALGQLIGNKFMVAWRVFGGFVQNLPYASIGSSVATALNGVFSTISFSEIGDYLATAMNGAFTTLYNFATDFNWTQMVSNIAGGINTFVAKFDWKGNGQKLEVFLQKLCDALTDFVKTTDWEAVGNGIGTFLAQIDWWGHLWQVVHAIKDAIGRLFDGLEASGTAGKIVSFLGKAFLAIKVAQIFGIDKLVTSLVGFIGSKLIGSQASLSGDLTTLIGNAASGAAGSFSELATSLAPLVGTAGLIIGVGAAATIATSELAGLVETMQGGNGIGTTFGNTMNNFIQTLQRRGDILSGSAEEIWQLKESLEQEGMTAEEKVSATQKLIDKLGEMGVTSDQAEQAFSALYQQGLITDDMFDVLAESIKTLDNNTTNMAGSIDLSKQSIDDLYDNVLPQLQTQLGLSADQVTSLDTALLETESAGGTAQDAFNNIMARAEEMGLNTESVAKVFSQVFPDAVKETESSTKTAMENTQNSVEDSMTAAERSISEHTSNISSDSDTNWKAAEGFATGSVGNIGQTAYDKMKEVYGVISRYNSSIKDDFDTKWGKSKDIMVKAIEKMASTTQSNSQIIFDGVKNVFNQIPGYIRDVMNDAVGKVNSTVSRINSTLGDIERGFTFSYNVQLPNGGRRWGNYSMSLPRVSNIPYLASGAVIPPRSEFLAVLGDQKNGRNLEAPEGVIRDIINDAFDQHQQGRGGNFRFTAQLNRRTIFDEMIDEAKLRRDASGANPFELG
nr:MAG TPA: minor tail protein [Bacteriophage sp.]